MLALFFIVFGVADAGGATGFVGGHAVAATSVFGVTVAVVARVTVLRLIVAGAVVDSVVPTYVADVAAVGIRPSRGLRAAFRLVPARPAGAKISDLGPAALGCSVPMKTLL